MNILITGATGFLGSQITTDLFKAGHHITCCVRNVSYAKKLFPATKIIFCDFTEDTQKITWISRLENIDILINAVGIFYHPNKQIMWKIHFQTPQAIFDACVEVKVKKIIHVSALGIENYDADYAKSKLAADQYLINLPVISIILRPSLIYGKGSYGGTSLFRGLAGLPMIIPLPGKGDQKFQPIYLPDLSSAIVNLVHEAFSQSTTLHAVSKSQINIKEMLKIMRDWLGFPTAVCLYIPIVFIKAISFLGNFIINSVWSSDGLKMLTQNNISNKIETERFKKTIGFDPRDFREGIFSQPSTVQDHWHARLYFVKPLLQISLAFLWIFTAICSVFLYSKTSSFNLLNQIGVSETWQPILLYGSSLLNAVLGISLVFNFQVRKICLLQIGIMIIYSLIITIKLPFLWLEPFGPITKNIPIIIATYILYILENSR